MTANPKKCKLGFEEVEYLGYLIRWGNVKPQERKVHAVFNWPVPCTKTQVVFPRIGRILQPVYPQLCSYILPL